MKGTPHRGELGQAAVELALVLPILVMVLFAIFQFGAVFMQYEQVSSATNEGARRASNLASAPVGSQTATITGVVQGAVTVSNSNAFNPNSISVAVSGSFVPGNAITVTSTYPAQINILGMVVWSGNLTAAKKTRVVS